MNADAYRLHRRILAATEAALAEAEAKGQTRRARALSARLAEVRAFDATITEVVDVQPVVTREEWAAYMRR